MSTSARLRLLGTVAVAALSASLAAPAIAQNQAEVEFDNTAAPDPIIFAINTISALQPVIVDLQSIFGASSGTSATTGAFVLNDSIAGPNSSFDTTPGNILTARTRGNNADSSLGFVVNTPDADGAMILVGQQIVPDGTDITALAATLDNNIVGWVLNGTTAANVTASVNGNQAQAYTTFNSNFSTIDVEVPVGLAAVAGEYEAAWELTGAATATYFVTDIDQIANFNVAAAQVNFGFGNGQTDPNLATSNVDDTSIALAYLLDPATDPNTVSGAFSVDGNGVQAITQGNATDLSIFLFDAGASTMNGSAMVSTTQSSSDSTPPTGNYPGISAANTDTTIAAVFATEPQGFPPGLTYGLPDIVSAVGLDASVSSNNVGSSATINSGRNEIGLDGTLDIVNEDLSESNINVGLGTNAGAGATEVDAQISVINNQTAAAGLDTAGGGQLTGGASPQGAVAETIDALVGLAVEDVDGTSNLAVSDNTISASANGQLGSNSILNNGQIVDPNTGNVTDLGTGTSNIEGTFASLNRQLLVAPEVSAEVNDSTIQALIGSSIDGQAASAFGGLVDSALTVGDDPATDDVNEGNLFQAVASGNNANASIDLSANTIEAPGTGVINSENNQDNDDFTFSESNAGINMVNWQFQNLPGDDAQGSVFAGLNDVDIEVFVNYRDGVIGTEEAVEISDAVINVNGNGGTASATLNGYAGTANIQTALGFEGTIGQLSHQYTNGVDEVQYTVESEVLGANISVDLGVNGAAENINASVSANSYLSLANGNDSQQSITMNAGTQIEHDADTIAGDNAVIAENVQNNDIETRVTDIEGAAAFLAVSDQTLRATVAEARVDDVEIELLLAAPGDGTNSLSGSVLALSGNSLVAQVLGNNATNSVDVSAVNSIGATEPDSGAIAGIVSSQSSVAQENIVGGTGLSAESFFEAEVANTEIHADVMTVGAVESISDVTLNVTGNTLTALTRGNSVNNSVSVSAADINATVTTGALLETGNGVDDMNLTVDDSALYILNRQRNEGNDTVPNGSPAELGPSVSSFVAANAINANVNGGVDGADTLVVNLTGNSMQGVAAGNVAGNAISINAGSATGTADAAAGILNRQGNSGNIETDVDGGNTIQATLDSTDGATHVDLTLNVNNNEISGTATGSIATNTIVAAGNSLNGTIGPDTGSVYIGPAAGPADQIGAVLTDTGTLDSNPDAYVNGNLAILNTQRNYGIPGDDGPGTPNVINSEVENSTISLDIVGDVSTATSTLSLSGNVVRSQSGANQATNSISLLPASSQPTYASVLNNQGVELTNVSAAAVDTEVTLNVDGDFDTGTTTVSGNAVLASASLNSASNTVTAQSTVGSLPSATIVNYQTSTDSNVSATNAGTTISHSSAGLTGGTFSNSTSTVSGNQIGSSATINNSTNTISSPGQTFTRTSSF